jgi:CheY-like chemotaxis protein
MMGGEVGVDSAEGEGSEFWFTAVFERQATEGKDEAADNELPFCVRDARILLVEDNATNRRVVLGMLEKLHVEADAVADGVEALEALARTSYDLLLMDCLMPRMDGYETTRRIRAMEGAVRGVPIVAVTANAMKGDREKCLETGMNDYLSKPVSRSALAKMLEKWLPLPDTTGVMQCTDSTGKAPISEEETTPEGIVWDRAVLLHRLDGDEELTDEIAAEFLEDMPDDAPQRRISAVFLMRALFEKDRFLFTPCSAGCVALSVSMNVRFSNMGRRVCKIHLDPMIV